MRKWKVMLSLFVLLFLFSQIGYASNNKTIQVSMNGTKVSVTQVPIIMDGQAINTEFPSFVHTNRTLVPIRFIAESYGAEVGWNQNTKTVTVNYGDKEGKFTINSNTAIINGKKRILDQYAIPRLATLGNKDTRTMVPLRFINEIFGYEIGWSGSKNAPYINSKNSDNDSEKPEPVEEGIGIISNVSLGTGNVDKGKLIVNSNANIEYEAMFLQETNELVIDIKDSKLSLKDTGNSSKTINIKDTIVEKVECFQFSTEPSIVRLIVKINTVVDYDISLSDNKKDMIISFENKVSRNKVKAVTQELVDGKEAIVIQTTLGAKFNSMKLSNPERIVIDVMDSLLEGNTYYNYDYDLGFIKGVRVSQFNGDNNYNPDDKIVRVVLDVKEGVSDSNVKIDTYGDKIVIYPEKSFWENISYTSDGGAKVFTIDNLEETKYSVDYDAESKLMEVVIPTDNVELNEGTASIKDGIIDEVKVTKDKEETKLLIKFRRNIEYILLSKEIDNKVSLWINKGENEKSTDKLIVIDAGHGGKDPGAISTNKRREKDLNLSVSLKLDKQLQALGYNTIMTRNTDEFVDLYERARIANDNYADLFISIHGNSIANNNSIAGIQVLYCPATKSPNKEVDQYPFAKAIMDELLKATGASNKGIIQRPGLVVIRETKMPAVLVETGFLTNPAEEKLLFTEEYQKKIVDGIIKGIEKYFEMY